MADNNFNAFFANSDHYSIDLNLPPVGHDPLNASDENSLPPAESLAIGYPVGQNQQVIEEVTRTYFVITRRQFSLLEQLPFQPSITFTPRTVTQIVTTTTIRFLSAAFTTGNGFPVQNEVPNFMIVLPLSAEVPNLLISGSVFDMQVHAQNQANGSAGLNFHQHQNAAGPSTGPWNVPDYLGIPSQSYQDPIPDQVPDSNDQNPDMNQEIGNQEGVLPNPVDGEGADGENKDHELEAVECRTHSLPHRKYGPYTCPRRRRVFPTSQCFAAHISRAHHRHETPAQKRHRLAKKHKNRNLCWFETAWGLTMLLSSYSRVPGTIYKRSYRRRKSAETGSGSGASTSQPEVTVKQEPNRCVCSA